MARVAFDKLDEQQHQASKFDLVIVVSSDRSNDEAEAIWQRPPDGESLDPDAPMPVQRQLTIEAAPSDDVRGRLEALGYDADGFVEG